MCSIDDISVRNFKEYLTKQKQSPHTIRNKIQYAKRFYYVLQEENAQDLMSVSPETRQYVMNHYHLCQSMWESMTDGKL